MEDWPVIIGAIATAVVTISGALGAWWLKILDAKNKAFQANVELEQKRLEREEKERKDKLERERREKRDVIKEYVDAIELIRHDREEDRKQMHALRDEMQALHLRHARIEIEHNRCEQDKRKMQKQLDALKRTLARDHVQLEPEDDNANTPPSDSDLSLPDVSDSGGGK